MRIRILKLLHGFSFLLISLSILLFQSCKMDRYLIAGGIHTESELLNFHVPETNNFKVVEKPVVALPDASKACLDNRGQNTVEIINTPTKLESEELKIKSLDLGNNFYKLDSTKQIASQSILDPQNKSDDLKTLKKKDHSVRKNMIIIGGILLALLFFKFVFSRWIFRNMGPYNFRFI